MAKRKIRFNNKYIELRIENNRAKHCVDLENPNLATAERNGLISAAEAGG